MTRPPTTSGGASSARRSPLTSATGLPMTSMASRNSVVIVACLRLGSYATCAPSAAPIERSVTYSFPLIVASELKASALPSTTTGVGGAAAPSASSASMTENANLRTADRLAIDGGRVKRRRIPGEHRSAPAAGRPKTGRFIRIAEQRLERARERIDVARRERERRAAGGLDQRGCVGDDARRPRGHRLDDGQSESLVERRLDDARARRI